MIDFAAEVGTGFGTVLWDPPWPSGSKPDSERYDWRDNMKPRYGTISGRELIGMGSRISEIAAKDAMLVTWATWMHLPLAVELITACGFTYATGMPWLKIIQPNSKTGAMFIGGDGCPAISIPAPIYGPGMWFQHCTELILIARRGRPFGKLGNPRPARKGIIIAPRQEHSRKPEELQKWIEAKFPGPYVELFARRQRPGWTCWGNEL
jgi:N6-adenosine-specific RNA methylase IME4